MATAPTRPTPGPGSSALRVSSGAPCCCCPCMGRRLQRARARLCTTAGALPSCHSRRPFLHPASSHVRRRGGAGAHFLCHRSLRAAHLLQVQRLDHRPNQHRERPAWPECVRAGACPRCRIVQREPLTPAGRGRWQTGMQLPPCRCAHSAQPTRPLPPLPRLAAGAPPSLSPEDLPVLIICPDHRLQIGLPEHVLSTKGAGAKAVDPSSPCGSPSTEAPSPPTPTSRAWPQSRLQVAHAPPGSSAGSSASGASSPTSIASPGGADPASGAWGYQ